MSVWVWILVGIGVLFAVSLLVSVAVAAILESIGRDFSKLVELEAWASSPLTRANEPTAEYAAENVVRNPGRL